MDETTQTRNDKEKRPGSETPEGLDQESLQALLRRIRSSSLPIEDINLIVTLVSFTMKLRQIVETRRFGVLSLLRRIFGLKTEKSKSTKSGGDSKGKRHKNKNKKGHGRNGRDDYPGAKRITCRHENLKVGEPCPSCLQGELSPTEPGVHYQWQGHTPFQLIIFELERFICHTCKMLFTASLPKEYLPQQQQQQQQQQQLPERYYDAKAHAMAAIMRYELGVPLYRLSQWQKVMGIPISAAVLYRLSESLKNAVLPIFSGAVEKASTSQILLNDDTPNKILDVCHPSGEEKGQRTQTSCILAKNVGEPTIAIYATSTNDAGDNLAGILDLRPEGLPVPMQMCDGLAANQPDDHITDMGNCLDHARRKFFDLQNSASRDDVTFILNEFGKVYSHDRDAKNSNLSPAERLVYHQVFSKPVMDNLYLYLEKLIAEKKVEPNSAMGTAIKYCTKRWGKLTRFLDREGMPLSNAETEQAIKRLIRVRKNSLFYKTNDGAQTGDVLMTIIQTAKNYGINAFSYLADIFQNSDAVAQNAEPWMPWNYKPQLCINSS